MKILSLCIAACAALMALPVQAQKWPDKPIHWILPYAAGGPSDALVRAIAPKLSDELGVPVVIENRTGAGGNIAMMAVVKAAPDGYTIGLGGTGTHAVNPHIQLAIPYDVTKDFTPISPIVSYVNVLVVNSNVPVKTVGELVAYAKSNPTTVTFASGGKGTSNQLSAELLRVITNAPMVHVPYRGSGPAMIDLIAGHVTFMFDILVTAMPQIESGKVRALAVTSAKRSPYAPNIPTMSEAGVQGYEQAGNDLWFGIFAPPNLPDDIAGRLHAAVVKAMNSPEIEARLRTQSYDKWTLPPKAFADFVKTDYQKWGKVIEAAKIEKE